MTFDDQAALCREFPHNVTWVDVGGHESVAWARRKVAEIAHFPTCGQECRNVCGGTAELLQVPGVRAVHRGDLIVPTDGILSLDEILRLAVFTQDSACTRIVFDDLAAILAQHPSRRWIRTFAEAAMAAEREGVLVMLLAAPADVGRWPLELPRPRVTRAGKGWWLGWAFSANAGVR